MRLIFPGIPTTLVSTLESETETSLSPLADQEEVEVIRTPEALLFKCSAGFFFTGHSGETDVETYRTYVNNPHTRKYMPIAYEVDEDPTIPERVKAEFSNKHSQTACEKIQMTTHREGGKKLLLLQIPHEIVQGIFYKTGGQLLTTVSGPAENLRSISLLAPIVPEGAEGHLRRVFVTPYTEGEYETARSIHYQAVAEVVNRGGAGISIGPLAVWAPPI